MINAHATALNETKPLKHQKKTTKHQKKQLKPQKKQLKQKKTKKTLKKQKKQIFFQFFALCVALPCHISIQLSMENMSPYHILVTSYFG